MTSPREAWEQLGQARTAQEAMQSLRATHGRGTSRHIADTFGVSMRTAQRWLAGTQRPRNEARVIAAADTRTVRSQTLRSAQGVTVGRVAVVTKSSDTPDGQRNIGTVLTDFGFIADAIDSGATEREAHAMLDEAILDAYGGRTGDHLNISEYGQFDIF